MEAMSARRVFLHLVLLSASVVYDATCQVSPPKRYFGIQVVDEQTARGVPMVELQTTSSARYYTDSNGLIAFDEPGLMNKKVWFGVSAHGYEFPRDGFGMRGVALETKPGGGGKLKIKRLNIAERLYRITGQGIYRDTVLLGRKPPIAEPLLNAQVTGQDGILNPTLATGGVARLQVVFEQAGSSKGLPYISSSCLALSRGGDCSGRANFNCSSKSFWSASGWV